MPARRDLNGQAALRFPGPTNWRQLRVQSSSALAVTRVPVAGSLAPRGRGSSPRCATPSGARGQLQGLQGRERNFEPKVPEITGEALQRAGADTQEGVHD